MVIRFICSGVIIQRANTAVAAARHVYTNNKVFGRVKKSIRPYKPWPPFYRVAVGCKCMKYPYHIVLAVIKLTMGSISQMKAMQCFAAFGSEVV